MNEYLKMVLGALIAAAIPTIPMMIVVFDRMKRASKQIDEHLNAPIPHVVCQIDAERIAHIREKLDKISDWQEKTYEKIEQLSATTAALVARSTQRRKTDPS